MPGPQTQHKGTVYGDDENAPKPGLGPPVRRRPQHAHRRTSRSHPPRGMTAPRARPARRCAYRPLRHPPPHEPLQPHDRPQPPQLGSRCLITLLHPPPEVREAHRAALLPLAQLLGLGRRRRRRIADRPLVPTTMPSMLHFSRVSKDNEHAMHLHRVAPGSSKLTGNAGDVLQLPAVQAPPPPGPGTTTSARRLAALHRAAREYIYITGPCYNNLNVRPCV